MKLKACTIKENEETLNKKYNKTDKIIKCTHTKSCVIKDIQANVLNSCNIIFKLNFTSFLSI